MKLAIALVALAIFGGWFAFVLWAWWHQRKFQREWDDSSGDGLQ